MRKRLFALATRVATNPRLRAGRKYRCPCCGRGSRRFVAGGYAGRPEAACPWCGSLERHRVMALFLRDWLNDHHPRDILHFAPERGIRPILRRNAHARYVAADLDSAPGVVSVDIMAMPFEDASFDLIVCSHVLEHVLDDRAAMAEMRRVLRPRGTALLQAPVRYGRDTDEDTTVTDPVIRYQRFGQPNHWRFYGEDLSDRLSSAGFAVQVVNHELGLSPEVRRRHRLDEPWGGFSSASDIYVCEIPGGCQG
ncbi:MAG: methyltransferase domain-containing protein [Actinomycetota bacterium]|nr:methyltransferase domain-containing protein [Actinomycetota bacterium]